MAIDPNLLSDLLDHARSLGATDGDAIAMTSVSNEVQVRLGEVEQVVRAEEHAVGLRVFVGQRAAMVSGNDLRAAPLRELVAHAVDAAKRMDPDPDSRVPGVDELADIAEELPLFDPAVAGVAVPELIALAQRAEQAARDADARITNSEGGSASTGVSSVTWVSAGGVRRERKTSSIGVSAVPVAAHDGEMQVDWWYASRRRLDQLPEPEGIGARAAARALRRLGGRPVATCEVPVIFEAPVASRVLGDFIGGLNGERVARGASWLAGRLGEQVAHPAITLVDDPLVAWGVASRPFDGEGFASRRTTLVEDGVLRAYLTNLRTARRIGATHTRSASRGVGSAPGVSATHVHLAPQDQDLQALMRQVGRGLLVTATMGHGSDLVAGTYSQGATGQWFEGGEIQHPVNEVTVAGELAALMGGIAARADDLDRFRGVSAPSFLVERLTVAGAG